MRIYTSYFANAKKLKEDGIMMIGIALYPPKWFYGVTLRMLAPSWSILKQTSTDEEYIRRFKGEILSRLQQDVVLSRLNEISKGKDVALCCFEKPGEFCHRHIVADWLNEKLEGKVEEYSPKERKEEFVQLSLF